ncbi:MAG: flagellar brake domain-containing protein [Azonexus sp.]|nr:flagellar brake domain-containing protein [Azonexus sp.]MDZ4314350.1 flagellar brake domain-containing protein [Azonexus sp.]
MAGEKQSEFIKVGANDVEVGKPLLNPLYDSNRILLLKRGAIIESARQCELLIERGLYRNLNERAAPLDSAPVAKEALTSRESISTLEATKIRIGDALQMQSSPDAPRLTVKLIGYLKNRGLIVSVPEAEGEFVMLKEGQSFIVRFFSGQNAYAFTSVVARQTSVPFPHVHLSYPREVRGLEIRKDSRIDVDLIASVSVEGETGVSAGKIVNLSTGGAALRTKGRLGSKGDIISVKFKISINDMQSFAVFDSLICSIADEKVDPAMPFLHGIKFVKPDQNMTLAVAAFVYQKIVGGTR